MFYEQILSVNVLALMKSPEQFQCFFPVESILQNKYLPISENCAILSTQYVLVPLTKLLKPEQVEYIISDCDIKCIITDKIKLESIEEIKFDGHIISYETTHKDLPSFEEIYKYYNKPYSCDVSGHDNAIITYSFGLSGKPNGIVISHRNLIDSARVVCQYLKLEENDVISGLLLFNLDYGLNQIFCSLYKRATLALHRFVLPTDFFNHIINDKVTVLPVMPINITDMFDEDIHIANWGRKFAEKEF